MAFQTAEEEQQFAADRAQEASMDYQEAHIRRQHEAINHLTSVINFRRARAAEHDDFYFIMLLIPALIVDFADMFDAFLGGVVEFFTFWVPGVYVALFVFGPRNYVWKDTEGIIARIAHITFKITPFVRALPAHTSAVSRNWFTSALHRDADLAYAALCEIELKILLHGKKSRRGKK